ncbi:MAG: DUF3800 domain-containing protein [Candidatus Yanofskybacteria bacterium]|nr:DUF3800 domain-containing protein [Candidatus Yanofskybacteria bacterium]
MIDNDFKKIKLPVFFLDETGILKKGDDPYFALGVIRTERPHELQRKIRTLRDKLHFYEELKWNKVSPLKYEIIKQGFEAFFKDPSAVFSSIILKKNELDFKTYFNNNLLKVYRSFTVDLLKRNIGNGDNQICTVLADDYFYPDGINLELATRGIVNDHYKKIVIAGFLQINSKSSDLLQLTDLLLGAVLYDLKIQDSILKKHPNLKSKLLDFLQEKLGIENGSFFIDKRGNRQDKFLKEKFKISIFKGTKNSFK